MHGRYPPSETPSPVSKKWKCGSAGVQASPPSTRPARTSFDTITQPPPTNRMRPGDPGWECRPRWTGPLHIQRAEGGGKTQHSRKGGMAGWLTGPDKYLGRDTGPPPPGRFAGFGSSKQDHSSPVPNRANLKPMDSSSSKRGTFGAAMSAAPVRGEGERGGRRK